MRYSVVYEQGDTSWGAYVPDLPGCVAVGATRAELETLIVEAIGAYLDDLRDSGHPVPHPGAPLGWSMSPDESAPTPNGTTATTPSGTLSPPGAPRA
jgi:predicted RNase H-like HicB family nuclease